MFTNFAPLGPFSVRRSNAPAQIFSLSADFPPTTLVLENTQPRLRLVGTPHQRNEATMARLPYLLATIAILALSPSSSMAAEQSRHEVSSRFLEAVDHANEQPQGVVSPASENELMSGSEEEEFNPRNQRRKLGWWGVALWMGTSLFVCCDFIRLKSSRALTSSP